MMTSDSKKLIAVFVAAVLVLITVSFILSLVHPPDSSQTQQEAGLVREARSCKNALLSGGQRDSFLQSISIKQNDTQMLMMFESTFNGTDPESGLFMREVRLLTYVSQNGETSTTEMDGILYLDGNYSCVRGSSRIMVMNQSVENEGSCMGAEIMPEVCGDDTAYVGNESIITQFGTFEAEKYSDKTNATMWVNKQFAMPLRVEMDGMTSELLNYTRWEEIGR